MHKEKPQIVKIALAEKGFKHGVFLMLLFAAIDTLLLFMIAYCLGLAIDNGINQNTNTMLFSIAGILVFIGLKGLRANIHSTTAKKFADKIFKSIRMIVFGSIIKRQSSSNDDMSSEATAQARQSIEKLSNTTLIFCNHYICILFHILFVIVLLVSNLQLSLLYFTALPITLLLFTLVYQMGQPMSDMPKKHITIFINILKILLLTVQLAALIFLGRQLNMTLGEIAAFALIAGSVTRALWEYPLIVFHAKYTAQILKDLEAIVTSEQLASL